MITESKLIILFYKKIFEVHLLLQNFN